MPGPLEGARGIETSKVCGSSTWTTHRASSRYALRAPAEAVSETWTRNVADSAIAINALFSDICCLEREEVGGHMTSPKPTRRLASRCWQPQSRIRSAGFASILPAGFPKVPERVVETVGPYPLDGGRANGGV